MVNRGPSRELFQLRLAYLINKESMQEREVIRKRRGLRSQQGLKPSEITRANVKARQTIARKYERSPETIRRWLLPEGSNLATQPSINIRTRVSAAGRRIGGPVETRRDASGRFVGVMYDARAQRAIDSINEARTRRRQIAREAATNIRQERLAEMMGEELSEREADNIARRLENLQLDTARGIDTQAQWRQWERDYYAAMGGI